MLNYLKKFALDILPSVAATIIGAYIVNHYIATRPDVPAAAVTSTETKAELVPIANNLRHNTLDELVNEATLASGAGDLGEEPVRLIRIGVRSTPTGPRARWSTVVTTPRWRTWSSAKASATEFTGPHGTSATASSFTSSVRG